MKKFIPFWTKEPESRHIETLKDKVGLHLEVIKSLADKLRIASTVGDQDQVSALQTDIDDEAKEIWNLL